MDKGTKSAWSLLNPLTWIDAVFRLLGAIFRPILEPFGLLQPPTTEEFENLSRADVDDAQRLAAEQEAAVDELQKEMSPAEIVRAYARTDPAGRAVMDLSALGLDEQDWLLRLSDEDLDKLSMSTVSGCARSLENRAVLPIYTKPCVQESEAAEILRTPTEEELEQMKMDFIAARFRELWQAPGVPNPNPKFTPTTLH